MQLYENKTMALSTCYNAVMQQKLDFEKGKKH
jgi:hypothetical protein